MPTVLKIKDGVVRELETADNIGIGVTTSSHRLSVRKGTAGGFGGPSLLQLSHDDNQGMYLTSVDSDQNAISFAAEFTGGESTDMDGAAVWTARNAEASIIRDRGSEGLSFFVDIGLTIGNTYTPTRRMIINPSGNVGIGTASPSDRLHVQTPDGIAARVRLLQANQKAWAVGMPASSTSFVIRNDSDSIDTLTILSGGNVGIGTTSPLTRLHIAATSAGGATAATIQSADVSGNENVLAMRSSRGTLTVPVGSGGEGNRIDFLRYDGGGAIFRTTAQIVAGGSTGDAQDGYLALYTKVLSGSLTEKVRIIENGNVGIGTTTPTARKLHVTTTENNASHGIQIDSQGTGGLESSDIILKTTTRQWQVSTNKSANQFLITDNTAGPTRMLIDTAGFVGINTTPANRLHVYSGDTIPLKVNDSGVNCFIDVKADSGGYWRVGTDNNNPSASAFILYSVTAGDYRFSISNTGIVQVGPGSGASTTGLTTGSDFFVAQGDAIRITGTRTPTGTSAGVAGEIAWDTNFIYVCTAANTWKRATLAAF